MADIFDADIFHLALQAVCLVHRADGLVREQTLISLATLGVPFLRRYNGGHKSVD